MADDILALPESEVREPIAWGLIPLPEHGDWTHDILDPVAKAIQKDFHELKVRRIMEERLKFHDRAKRDTEYRELLYEQCRRSCSFFINYFLWTYDDRIGEAEPFILYEFQEEQIVKPYERFIQVMAPNRVTLGYGKSRGQGFTWASLACRLWRFLFAKNWSTLIGTENRDDVDDGGIEATHESMFGKLRFAINSLPKWMQRDLLGPLFKKDSFNKRWSIKNPKKPRNVIHGKQLGGMFGRGRRYSEVFGDEVAYAEEMKNADTSLKQTTNRFCFGSTPKGRGNFFDGAMHGLFPGVVKFWMWWAQHPLCDADWYNEQRNHMSDEQIAQELDINFDLSLGGRVLEHVDLNFFVKIPDGDSHVPFMYDPNIPLEVVIDPGFADAMAIIWCQWNEYNGKGRIVDFVQTERKSVDWCIPFITGRIPELTHQNNKWAHSYNSVEETIIKRHAGWNAPEFVYGDSAGGAKQWTTGHSAWDELSRYEVWVDEIKITNDKESLRRLELFIRHVRFSEHLLKQRNGSKRVVPTFAEVVTQWRYPERNQNATTGPNKPVHNVYCHGGDCLKMWAQVHDIPDSLAVPVESGRIKRARGSDFIDLYEGNPHRR